MGALKLINRWCAGHRYFARWLPGSQAVLRQAKCELNSQNSGATSAGAVHMLRVAVASREQSAGRSG